MPDTAQGGVKIWSARGVSLNISGRVDNLKKAVVCGFAALFAASAALAQAFPERPLRFVIPFPPGGGADNLARVVSVPAAERLGQQIVIDNRAGAAGNIAAEVVSKAAPDGYTLLQANVSHAISTSLYKKLNYDLLHDFVPVTQLASIPFVLAAYPGTGVGSVKDLIARAKAKPGDFAYASSGNGGPSHLAMELLKSMAGVDIRHIPYKGAVPGATDLIAGNVHFMFFTVSAALPLMAGGRLKTLGIASPRRTPLAPDLPTISESGLPGFEATTWFGVMAPRRTPDAVTAQLHRVFTGALKIPDVRERLMKQGFEIVGSTPDEFAAYVKSEIPKWARVVKASAATVD
jgi:tripartite-type tricarboxylate transporter receptor subunit TctC